MTELRISPDLALPLEFATEGVLVTGMRGSGKTNTAVRFVEVEYEAGIPFALVDPKGDTHGIRSSADGKAPGLSVPVFGGLHGDFPLEAATGARIADLLVDEMLSAVLDVSMLSKTGELPKFLTAFCNQLMHRHQLEPHVRIRRKVHSGKMSYSTAYDLHKRGKALAEGGSGPRVRGGKLTGDDVALVSHWRRRHDRLLAGIHAVLKARPRDVPEFRMMLDRLLKLDLQPLDGVEADR